MDEIDENSPVESLETWLSHKPYWEQYVWKVNLEKDVLDVDDVEQCYRYLCEDLGIADVTSAERADISFKNEIAGAPVESDDKTKIALIEVKDLENVNALTPECAIKFGLNLTLIYGENGSGKSGVGRLFCNACFSRGDRDILPNVKGDASDSSDKAKATFILQDVDGEPHPVKYELGDNINVLKCFSVFDAKSVLIHLDNSNNVNFTPAQILIFDKVADTNSLLEVRLKNEKNEQKKDDPFLSMFLTDETTTTAVFYKGIDADTTEEQLLEHLTFDPQKDEEKMAQLREQIKEKTRLDIPKKKLQLEDDRTNLCALKESLQAIIDKFDQLTVDEINTLIDDIAEKKKVIENLSIKNFDDGILKSVGSVEWKALISAAKTLYEHEQNLHGEGELKHCMLCHQELGKDAKNLFELYWQFLSSKAESELETLLQSHAVRLQDIRSMSTLFPKFLPTDAGIKVMSEEDPEYLAQLKVQNVTLSDVRAAWEKQIKQFQKVVRDDVPSVNLKKIDTLVRDKETEKLKLVDPAGEIANLNAQLTDLQHNKEATAVKDAALQYLDFLKWSQKASRVNFSGIRMATTKKRTEFFLVRVAKRYKGVFNQELADLGCDFNLIMHTRGDQGDTVKEYRLDFAEDYNPSEILSEGEQKACSLADFLTETQLDGNNYGIVFDDPVTSLDHKRKDKIAKRLASEAQQRQVIIFTHDVVFMSMLTKHAARHSVPVVAHWMMQKNDVPGYVEENTSPKLASVASLKNDADVAMQKFDTKGAKEQEQALGNAIDYLRSACEALVEEVLFADTIQRYDDHVRVQNLQEVIFNQPLALKIVELDGRLSEMLLAHNRSPQHRQQAPGKEEFSGARQEFDELESALKEARKAAKNARSTRKKVQEAAEAGW